MAINDQRLLAALLRSSLFHFVRKAFATVSPGEVFLPNWHLEALCYHLELVRAGKIRRLKIEVPPRSLKSVCASVALPAFILGHDPTAKIITVSYSSDLAAKHAADCRAVMQSAWYAALFPATKLKHFAAVTNFLHQLCDPADRYGRAFPTCRHFGGSPLIGRCRLDLPSAASG